MLCSACQQLSRLFVVKPLLHRLHKGMSTKALGDAESEHQRNSFTHEQTEYIVIITR